MRVPDKNNVDSLTNFCDCDLLILCLLLIIASFMFIASNANCAKYSWVYAHTFFLYVSSPSDHHLIGHFLGVLKLDKQSALFGHLLDNSCFDPSPPKGGLSELPQRFFAITFLTEKDIKMKFWLIVNGLTTNL